jgi:hypothetical protein
MIFLSICLLFLFIKLFRHLEFSRKSLSIKVLFLTKINKNKKLRTKVSFLKRFFIQSSDLLEDGVEIEIMWIPAHVGLEGNEIVDERAKHAALNDAVFERPLPPVDFQGLARSVLLRECRRRGTLRILVDSLTPYSRRFLFNLGLRVEGRTGNYYITSDLRWLRTVVQLENMPSLLKKK